MARWRPHDRSDRDAHGYPRDTCAHLCRYRYANTDAGQVRRNLRAPDRSELCLSRGELF